MPRKAKLDSRGMRLRPHWPRLTEIQQSDLLEFLCYWRAHAETAAEKLHDLMQHTQEPALYVGNLEHWKSILSAIDWLIHHVNHRLEYLEWKQAKVEGRLVETPIGPDTLSSPAASASPSKPTSLPAKGRRALKPRIEP